MRTDRDLTTSQVARLLRVSMQTVHRLFDRGALPGYRVPLSRFRRSRLIDVVRFAKEHGIPLYEPELDQLRRRKGDLDASQ